MSGYSVDVTLRGEHYHVEGKELAKLFSSSNHLVLTIKGGCIAKFNGKTIGIISK